MATRKRVRIRATKAPPGPFLAQEDKDRTKQNKRMKTSSKT